MTKYVSKDNTKYDISPIKDINDIKIGDIVVITHAHKFEYGYWSCYSDNVYEYIGIMDTEYTFRDVKYENTIFSIGGLRDSSGSAYIKGLMTDNRYLRKLKIKRLLKENKKEK